MRLNKICGLFLVLCFSVWFIGCTGNKGKDPVWKIVDIDLNSGNSIGRDENHDNCFLSIINDSYVFFLNGYFSQGKVEQNGREYRLYSSKNNKLVAAFTIEEEHNSEATIRFTRFELKDIQKTRNNDASAHSAELPDSLLRDGFKVDIIKEKRGKADPYLAVNNQWRSKADHKESEKEIRNRIRNHVQFMQVYFENALELGLRVVSENNLASPFETYTNGISMREFNEIKDWQDLFYDEEDARKGYEMIENEMKKDFALKETKNAFELNADIYRKLLKMID